MLHIVHCSVAGMSVAQKHKERNGRKSERGQNARSQICFKSGNHFLQLRVRVVGLFVRHKFDEVIDGCDIAHRHDQRFRASQCFGYWQQFDNGTEFQHES